MPDQLYSKGRLTFAGCALVVFALTNCNRRPPIIYPNDGVTDEVRPYPHQGGTGSGNNVTVDNKSADNTIKKFGPNKNLTCQQYVSKFWSVGNSLTEQGDATAASFISIRVKLKMETKVLEVSGSNVKISSTISAYDTSGKLLKQVPTYKVLDACANENDSAIPGDVTCNSAPTVATDSVTLAGKSAPAIRVEYRGCHATQNPSQTFSTIFWRVTDKPLAGIVKRSVSGSYLDANSLKGPISSELAAFTPQSFIP